MGYGLIGFGKNEHRDIESKDFRWNAWAWPRLLRMAFEHGGWKPEGTDAPGLMDENGNPYFKGEWDGGYCSNDHQMISESDARNLATALRKVLPKLPMQEWTESLADRLGLIEGATVEVVWDSLDNYQPGEVVQSRNIDCDTWDTYYAASDLEYFAAIGSSTVEEFIGFCELGPIQIN